MSTSQNVDGQEGLSAGKLAVVAIITLAVAFTIISLIAETGLDKY